jgi:hypothetical protein
MMIISGVNLGDIADEAISWVPYYDDDTKSEGTDKVNGDRDADGTAANVDVPLHLVTGIAGMFLFGMMGIISYFFAFEFYNMGDDDFTCDFSAADASTYAAVGDILKTTVDVESCQTNILKVFDIMDLNKSNMLERCEDALFQHYFGGSTKEFALKFSSPYTRASTQSICAENFGA